MKNKILGCDPGTFGAGCRGHCLCKNNATCNHITGACECGPGWRGQYCDRPCPDGFFGHKCRSVCSCTSSDDKELAPFAAKCHHVTGVCKCPEGWTGPDCRTPCPPDRYGENCAKSCVCANGGTCDRLTGHCNCQPGFMGRNCEEGKRPDKKF